MAEPKVIKGWLGWAVVGDGLIVYARTKAEALRRYSAKLAEFEPPQQDGPVPQQEGPVAEDVDVGATESDSAASAER